MTFNSITPAEAKIAIDVLTTAILPDLDPDSAMRSFTKTIIEYLQQNWNQSTPTNNPVDAFDRAMKGIV